MDIVPGFAMAEMTRGGRAYVLADGITCVVVDTGSPDGTLGVGRVLADLHRQAHEVRLILLTHAHRGHAGNAVGLHLLTGAPVACSAAAAAVLAAGIPAPRGLGRLLGGGEPVPPLTGVRILEPGERIDIAGGIDVLDAPGHAPGSLAFHLRGPDALCVGDAARVDRVGVLPPPGRHCVDTAAAAATARRLGDLGARVVAPGHGLPSVEGRLPKAERGRPTRGG